MFDMITYSVLEFQTTMEQNENFSINYWGKEFDYTNPQKKERTVAKRLAIIGLFILIAIATPVFALNFGKIELLSKKWTTKATAIKSPINVEKLATVNYPVEGKVIKNDSYWKISKRYCGTGEHYLTIQEKNEFKPLYEGDTITVICY